MSYEPKVRGILKYPTESLLTESKLVENFDLTLVHLVADMYKTMQNVKWGNPVGLAAPQIGENVKVFIARGVVYVNPELINKSNSVNYEKEGCYSLEDHKEYMVERPQTVWVKYQDISGVWHEEKLNGFNARVFCHEFDHLMGKVCNNI